jgi:2-oxoglutarate ferredoxin oxidoreductase subunit delta
MNRLEIDRDRCKACRLCIDVCTRHLLDLAEDLNAKGYHPIAIHDQEKCTACALCGIVCPEGSIAVYKEVKPKKAG